MLHHHSHENPVQTEGRLIRWAGWYDFVTNFMTLGQSKRLRRMTIELAALRPGERVLDVGCGTGEVTIPARQQVGASGYAAGIDPAPEMIDVASQKAQRKGLEIDFRTGVIEALPFPDASFDVVTASLMMHHLPPQLRIQGLAEIYRVLKPGGRLLIADLSSDTSHRQHLLQALTMHQAGRFGLDDLRQPLQQAGFKQVSVLPKRFFILGFLRAVKDQA